MKTKYITQDGEAGNEIDEFSTKEEAEKAIQEYEKTDREEGSYIPNFYEIKSIKIE